MAQPARMRRAYFQQVHAGRAERAGHKLLRSSDAMDARPACSQRYASAMRCSAVACSPRTQEHRGP